MLDMAYIVRFKLSIFNDAVTGKFSNLNIAEEICMSKGKSTNNRLIVAISVEGGKKSLSVWF